MAKKLLNIKRRGKFPTIPELDSEFDNITKQVSEQVQKAFDGVDTIKTTVERVVTTIPAPQVNSDWNAVTGVAEILNKPTIPAPQIQSDWAQADNTLKDYIKNKPTIVSSPNIWHPDYPPASPSSQSDEFNDSSFDTGKWTEFDPGNIMTITEDAYGLLLAQTTHGGDTITGIYQAIPSGDFTLIVKCGMPSGILANHQAVGIGFWEDATNTTKKISTFTKHLSSTANDVTQILWNNYTTYDSSGLTSAFITDPAYFKIQRVGTSYELYVSTNGLHWVKILSSFSMGFTPAHFGLILNNTNSGKTLLGRYNFFRYINSVTDGQMTGNRI